MLIAEAEWPVKLQMTDRPVCSGYVAVCADNKTLALPQARPTMLCIHLHTIHWAVIYSG